jgi:formate-nitrite transporter family protein
VPERSSRSRPFKAHATIFAQEIDQAVEELRRPARGQLISGFLAGIGVGFSVLLIAVSVTLAPDDLPALGLRLLIANAYAIGFVLVVMGRTDLFTEYTTITLLPVLTGDAAVSDLLRFWRNVFVANLVGGGLMALAIATIGPELGVLDANRFGEEVRELVAPSWWVVVVAASLAGWLMGLLSWLVVAGRESISQVVLIWIVGAVIGLGHLPHAITGSIEVFTATLLGQLPLAELGTFVLWTTVGNVVGGVVFAVSIRFSVTGGQDGDGASAR